VFALECAVAVFAVFLAGMVRDPRAFGNAILLGLALALGALGLAERLADTPGRAGHLLLLALVACVALTPFLIGCYLLANGVTIIRREGVRPANLLPALAGLAIFVVVGLDVAAARAQDVKLSVFATVATLVSGYVSFLFASYAIYAFIYGLLPQVGGADYVIVLGSGLRPDGSVPPILASRLNRGRDVWERLARRSADTPPANTGPTGSGLPGTVPASTGPTSTVPANTALAGTGPLLIVSGGKGDDERVSEAEAMAKYLVGRGFPADRIALEDQSRNTAENLLFSRDIMERGGPGARCVIVTSDFHAFRAAMIARRLGIRGQVTGARVAGYYRPSALLREFAAVFLRYRVVNLGICALLVLIPLANAAIGDLMPNR
jgi:uncharacterized SAM-binding protein YcdF (DUF218 family)